MIEEFSLGFFFFNTRKQSIKPASVTVRNGNAGVYKKTTKGKAKE